MSFALSYNPCFTVIVLSHYMVVPIRECSEKFVTQVGYMLCMSRYYMKPCSINLMTILIY